MITPTIGRVVWYTPNASLHPENTQPWPALICFVHNDGVINVAGFDSYGTPFNAIAVPLLQSEADAKVIASGYASWMPYQQAKAAEDAAKAPVAPADKAGAGLVQGTAPITK